MKQWYRIYNNNCYNNKCVFRKLLFYIDLRNCQKYHSKLSLL